MSHKSDLIAEDILSYLDIHENKGMLRFITCGSVDDGKSTLIGRLLYDSKLVFEDQMAAVSADSKRVGTQNGDLDLALLVDGLQAEREQGITIDVAYRFFSTEKRKFIVADTPGHEQYTRNMATGASTADLAVILIDARKGVLTQTRRHSYIVSLLGIKHVVVAINKMDLIDYDQRQYDGIVQDYLEFSRQLGLKDVRFIPVSALKGDNVFSKSAAMPWFDGCSLMSLLENINVDNNQGKAAFRMPVQWVNRPDLNFRGYSGTVASGTLAPGDRVSIMPSGLQSKVERIYSYDGDLELVGEGESVTLVLEDEIDVSRGDLICQASEPAEKTDQFAAHVLWMHDEPLLPERTYSLMIGTNEVNAVITDLRYIVNVNTLEHNAGRTLGLNEVGYCNLSTDQLIGFDPYKVSREMGGFILVDRFTNDTVGVGMIEHSLRRAHNITWSHTSVDKRIRASLKNQQPKVLWFTGLSGSGKSTVANLVEKQLAQAGKHTYLLDGDNVRHGLNRDLGFTDVDRVENIRRIAEVAKLFVDAGMIVLVSFISPFRSERKMARDLFDEGEFVEIYMDTPLEVCEQRDVKGLYEKARNGLIKNFTGIDSDYEAPVQSEIQLATTERSAEICAKTVVDYLLKQ